MTSNHVPLISAFKMTFRMTFRMTFTMTLRMTFKNGISRGFPGMTLKGTCQGTSSQVQVRSRSGPGQVQARKVRN